MIPRLAEFCRLLRRNGVRVSTAESIDAASALAAVGVADRSAVRAALAATLIKRAGDLPAFDELFGLYFERGAGRLARGPATSLLERLREVAGDAETLARWVDQIAGAAVELSPLARLGLGLRAPEVAALVAAAGADADLPEIRSPLQIGHYTYRLLERIGIDAAALEIEAALGGLAAAGGLGPAAVDAVSALVQDNLSALRAAIREHVEQEFRRQNLDYPERMRVRSLSDRPLTNLTAADVDALRHEVARLARILRARISLAPRRASTGRLDLGRTMRRSLATGGVPFVIENRRRQRRKPRLLVLCDISDSVRNVSRFMLQFVYTLHELFDRVESFAFVAELGELTDLFRRHDLERAMQMAYSGAAVNVFANSDYGRVLDRFATRHLDKVTHRTTVMVIGDGRNNYNPSRAGRLADIRRRAKQLIWLNPEPRAAWGFGDSAMLEYRPHCDRVVVVSNLDSLRRVVDQLVM